MRMSSFDRTGLRRMLADGAASMALRLNDTQLDLLIDYLALLAKWNAVYNLTAVRDPAQMVTQHLLDSLAILPAFTKAKNVLDVGSGGGLPGIVLAIWALGDRPGMRVSMIDTVHKKTAFLTQVKAELNLSNVTVYSGRVEQLRVEPLFDVITSRAFADLSDFVTWSGHLMADQGQFIAMKGVDSPVEEAGLPPGWKIIEKVPLAVPGLNAERHLVIIQRSQAGE